ncbi:transcriptional regulator, LuxR family [Marinobacterium lacunae]|uniref:Transcriptional regulator, LuxR family n=1 Tax=Marinobacterium lacunae TaxID=1232683 RepID=A0A081FXA9_9GAMM|nr:helix-turn-helix transcriptional regulator [Marinobacterium lacunae]KEA63164.1 transcriptional regulator, LuxR family [Marinobacterium lacunae]MBR9882672.1 helix-turn-helix transcriptional regulator [Oceanospirillales bacterium]
MADTYQTINVQDSWQKNLALLIDHIRMPSFPDLLIEYLATLCQFDTSLTVTYKKSFKPIIIQPTDPSEQSSTLRSFIDNGYYLLDPLFNAIQNDVSSGVTRISEYAPDSFESSDFYVNCYQYFGIVDEIVLIIKLDQSVTCAISLGRKKELGSITRTELRALQEIFPVLSALFRQFWTAQSGEYVQYEQSDDSMKQALKSFGSGVLTQREREITHLLLKGNSSKAIADSLNISVGTVKVHRKNIHAKLNTSTQSEIFTLFLNHLKSLTD